jgi:hypothetical protein
MRVRKAFLMCCLGLAMVFSGTLVTKAQTIVFQPGRYRVNYRGYRTDERGANLLREAVRQGYRAGYQAGVDDRNGRRRMNWRRNEMYRSANLGWENYVDRRNYQYYFQQGFQRGYQDGYNSRNRYGNGTDILGGILNTIFRARRY